MDSMTRTMRGEEAAVLVILVDAFARGEGLRLQAIERQMGPRGKRSPAGEAHAFLRDQGLIVNAIDEHGKNLDTVWVPSETGERRLPHVLRQGINNVQARIGSAQASNMPREEVERLEALLKLLPEDRAASNRPVVERDEDEAEEHKGVQRVAGRAEPKAAPKEKTKPRRSREIEPKPIRRATPTTEADGSPRVTSLPKVQAESPGGRRGAPASVTAPPRRAR